MIHFRLREALKLRGMTQRELSARIGVSPTTVSKWINSRRVPDSGHVRAICCELNISADWLLELTDEQI